jgi:hypothetical protein
LTAALIALACPAVVDAQVYKCVDRAGRTTYQQQPCPEAQKGGRLSLSVDSGSMQQRGDATPADLDPQARLKKIVPGMTRAAVAQAHGAPQEMRPGRPGENAPEVWIYRRTDLAGRIGFREGVVAWVSDDVQADGTVNTGAVGTPRQALAVGTPCAAAEGSLGAAETLEEDYDSASARKVLRMIWPPTTADPERTVVTCDGGVIARVDRTPMTPP